MCWLCPWRSCWHWCCSESNGDFSLENVVNESNEESQNLISNNASSRNRADIVNESIQRLEHEEWYHNNASVYEAITLLLWPGNEPGSFLVRARNKPQSPFILSIRTKDEEGAPMAKHYAICRRNDQFYISSRLPFDSVQTLIKTYVNDTQNLLNLCERIRKPCPRVMPNQHELSDVFKEQYQLNRSEIALESNPINSGNFGEVYRGTYRGNLYAVKKLKNNDFDRTEFLKEVLVMRDLDHKNIIRLKGICDKVPFLIVLEYMECGNLKNYMQNNQLDYAQKCYVTSQVADGMAYLEIKNIVHRDLAARNILLNPVLAVKISDFGLSRFMSENQYYTMMTDTQLPLRWMAPECHDTHKFNSKSDVWSFGITAMEIYTNGNKPYCEKQFNGFPHLLAAIKQNYRMPQPAGMPEEIYSIIKSTWREEPEERPNFTALRNLFQQFMEVSENLDYYLLTRLQCVNST